MTPEQSLALAVHFKEAAEIIKEKQRLDESFKLLSADITERSELWLAKLAALHVAMTS